MHVTCLHTSHAWSGGTKVSSMLISCPQACCRVRHAAPTIRPAPHPCSHGCSMRGRFERMIRGIQDQVCAAIEEVDGCNFRQDAWTRPSGGGGITRVLQVRHKVDRSEPCLDALCAV